MPSLQIPLIHVISWHNNKLISVNQEAYFYLEQDSWNDYNYYTSYHLHASGLITGDKKTTLIGHIRILKHGQQLREKYLIELGPLETLGEDFCSMPTSLDFYERLSLLPKEYREQILIALRDLIIYPEIREEFRDEDGYKLSLMRYTKDDDEIFEFAPLLLSRDYQTLYNMDLGFSFSIPEMEETLEFDFNSPKYGWSDKSLPNRIAVLIGRNGSGKSTLLSRISRIAYASPYDRGEDALSSLGQITPSGLGFTRIIILSYSAFDAFNTPGIYKGEKLAIIEEMKKGIGRYVFCGIRDIVGELEEIIPNLETQEDGKLKREDIITDRTENTRLKSIVELSKEFARNIQIIVETGQHELLDAAIKDLSEEQSMHNMFEDNLTHVEPEENENFFRSLSTGHKFVIHAVTSIIAYSAPRSLLLFDEPETHLHPPMLAALMKAVRRILNQKNAFMILATHSPVVLQETLHKHVSVIRREGISMKLYKPEIQTFGENIGILTQLAFGLTSDITDYHNTLDDVIRQESYEQKQVPDVLMERIERLFDIGLSVQARSYILSKIYEGQ